MLSGTDADVVQSVDSGIAVVTEQDDCASVAAIGDTSTIPAQRDAANAALACSHDEAKEFLRTRNYPGKTMMIGSRGS